MSEGKHTQGPWVFARANERDFHVRPTGRAMRQRTIGYRPIATVKHDKRLPESEAYANAALIAAAPELLDALQRLSDQCTRLRMAWQLESDAERTARVVIAKAIGVTE